jgi:hypothetical protein
LKRRITMRDGKRISDGRRSSKVLSLCAALLLAAGSILLPAPANAAPATITLSVSDKNGPVAFAKVAVYDAYSGRPVANGMTDPATGLFTFRSSHSRELLLVAHTSTGFVGSALQNSGADVCNPCTFALNATQSAAALQTVVIGTSYVNKPIQVFDFADDKGVPVAGANVAVLEWGSFEPVARGVTDGEGEFSFSIPHEMASDDFLAVCWSSDTEQTEAAQSGGIRHPALELKVAVQPDDSPTGGGGAGDGWPAV